MINPRKLPERCIGRSGNDYFSKSKELTVIMIPFERFSSFGKAVDDLYRTIDIPFNLIVVEGNAPDSVRASLERRQKRHKNITIIYSERQLSIGEAINLAVPHLNTPYAFLTDDDVRIPRGSMGRLLQRAKEKKFGIVCPTYDLSKNNKKSWAEEAIQGLASRICFVVSQEAIAKLGKFDETMTPCTAGIDIRMAAASVGISVCTDASTSFAQDEEDLIWPIDASFHSFQWNHERIKQSLTNLEKKWGIKLKMQDYSDWLARKTRAFNESQSFLFLWTWLNSKLKATLDKKGSSSSENLLLTKAA